MMDKSLLLLCALLAAPPAFACGMTSKLAPLEQVAGSTMVDDASGELPAPVVVVTEIVRGIGSSHANCDDTGLLSMNVQWPRGKYKLRDVGFEFSVVSGGSVYPIFPQGPQQAPVDGRTSDFLFMWRDGPPAQQKAFDLRVEVRAHTRDGRRGPPTLVQVSSVPGS